jgi:hypothetical protein
MPAIGVVRAQCDLPGYAGIQGLFWLMLCGGSVFGCWFLAVTLVEAIDTSCGIDQLLFAGKERVASRTDFYVQVIFASRARLE